MSNNIVYRSDWSCDKPYGQKGFADIILIEFPIFMVTIGNDGKTLRMNTTMLKVLGFTHEEIEDVEYLTTIVHREDRIELKKVFMEIVNSVLETIQGYKQERGIYFVERHENLSLTQMVF